MWGFAGSDINFEGCTQIIETTHSVPVLLNWSLNAIIPWVFGDWYATKVDMIVN